MLVQDDYDRNSGDDDDNDEDDDALMTMMMMISPQAGCLESLREGRET